MSSRRLRPLLHTAPIHELESNEGRWEGDDRSVCDVRHVQVAVLLAGGRRMAQEAVGYEAPRARLREDPTAVLRF
ncbi:MAG TPA: hypothetical protein VOB72_11405 [Candidatus Dormibacteraeota bacterium]|nr:hypothetical protein [Candidatus Dormibacteraeota bacterium]